MNSLYGKFGENPSRDVSNYVTDKEDLLIELFQKDAIKNISVINDRYYQYSATLTQNQQADSTTNFVIASYITARGRINLHKGIMALQNEYPECVICYCDTDSIYAANLPTINK